jgi:broad specificity phosphatase PhoE
LKKPVLYGIVRQNYSASPVPVQQLYLLRHGQTDFNVQGIVQGSGINSDLNARGREQAAQFWAAYKDTPFARVYTSHLKRTHQSVQHFIDAGLPHEAYGGLNEISWGNREGTRITPQEDAEYARVLAAWQAGNDPGRGSGPPAAVYRPAGEPARGRNRARVPARPRLARAALPAAGLPAQLHGWL